MTRAKPLRYLSVCSGIEAATAAWHPLGWTPAAFSEIEAFPRAVLAHHYPDVPNWGDMTKFKEWPDADVDVLVGGTPCQSFSVAGLRKGMDDPRGNLALTYLAIAARYRPQWLVWENVPGVLSSNGGRDFGSILGGMVELGYGIAYRVLDAQYFRVPQRRRRVFVVGYLGDWRRAAAVLFERESLLWNPPPRREAGEGIAGAIARCSFSGGAGGRPEGAAAGHFVANVAPTLNAHFGTKQGLEDKHALNGAGLFVTHALRADGFDASEDGTGRGTPLVAHAFDARQSDVIQYGDMTGHKDYNARASERAQAVTCGGNRPSARGGDVIVQIAVRRLTPRECERLQGFPDDYTLVPYRGKPAADGNRYKALGNSMAVPVMRWIGQRIALVDKLQPLDQRTEAQPAAKRRRPADDLFGGR